MINCLALVGSGALSAFYHDSLDIKDPQMRALSAYRLIAKMPTIAAFAYKHSVGEPYIYPRDDLSYSENFLHMMFATPMRKYEVPHGGRRGGAFSFCFIFCFCFR